MIRTDEATGFRQGREEKVVQVGVMYRCRRCKAARRVDIPTRVVTEWYVARNVQGFEEQGRNRFRRTIGGHTLPTCCGREMGGTEIRGRYVEDRPCDARCMNAVGHSCDCSCGGKNHGRGNAA